MGRYKYKLDTDKLLVGYKILVFIISLLFIATLITSIGVLSALFMSSNVINYWCISWFFIALTYVILKAICRSLIFDSDNEVKKKFRKVIENEKETV